MARVTPAAKAHLEKLRAQGIDPKTMKVTTKTAATKKPRKSTAKKKAKE